MIRIPKFDEKFDASRPRPRPNNDQNASASF
jgi:hypothetical protein